MWYREPEPLVLTLPCWLTLSKVLCFRFSIRQMGINIFLSHRSLDVHGYNINWHIVRLALLFAGLFKNKNGGRLKIRHLCEVIPQLFVKERLTSMAMSSGFPSIRVIGGEHILRCQWNQLFWKCYILLFTNLAPWAREYSKVLKTNTIWGKVEPGCKYLRDLSFSAMNTPFLSYRNTEDFALCLHRL